MPTLKEIQEAHNRISPFIHRTPVLTNFSLNELSGAELYFKCDNFQKAGSFKIRGAANTVLQLTQDELDRGVATSSSGNHGAALSMAVTNRGGKTKVVMPNNTSKIKVNNVERNGGEIVWCKPEDGMIIGTAQPTKEDMVWNTIHIFFCGLGRTNNHTIIDLPGIQTNHFTI